MPTGMMGELRKKYPVGISNYAKLIAESYYYVDKTLAVYDIMTADPEVTVITRPRRFGKTLFLSMLAHFFAKELQGRPTAGLFSNSLLTKTHPKWVLQHQGQYPVIFLSLKNIKADTFSEAIQQLKMAFSALYQPYEYLLQEPCLSAHQKAQFLKILGQHASLMELEAALANLSLYLFLATKKPVFIFVDEYDTPIQMSYIKGYYQKMISFMRSFLGSALKDNDALYKSVVTGVARVAKESLFSDLNNPAIYTVLDDKYSHYFGFTEKEVLHLLALSENEDKRSLIKEWYNGYHIGGYTLYNPWSIISYLSHAGKLAPYWVNTSTNELIQKVLARASNQVKQQLYQLMQRQCIEVAIDVFSHFDSLYHSDSALWHLLVSSGYLTATSVDAARIKPYCELKIPNQEIYYLFEDIVNNWFTDQSNGTQYTDLLQALLRGDGDAFTLELKSFMLQSASYFDVSGSAPEKFYHGLILGLALSLKETHHVISNQESGQGRLDVMILPKNISVQSLGIILEFKRTRSNAQDLKELANAALQQIKEKQYQAKLEQAGLTKALLCGLAFSGKIVETAFESCLINETASTVN